MKKRIVMPLFMAVLLIFTSITFMAPAMAASRTVNVRFGNSEIMSGKSFLVDSITYVPLRAFADSMGDDTVGWNTSTSTATVRTSGLYLTAKVGNLYITANDRCFYTVGAIKNINGTVYVPIRPMAQAYGLEVSWDSATYSVILTGSGRNYCASGSSYYNSDDLYWLSRIINAEASSSPSSAKWLSETSYSTV
jgi:N-acetylmuramoyl-L-alanine amidase